MNPTETGLMLAVMSVSYTIGAPIVGWIGDKTVSVFFIPLILKNNVHSKKMFSFSEGSA